MSRSRQFLECFESYYLAFEAWKNRDTLQVVDQLVEHFIELERLWISVMHNEGNSLLIKMPTQNGLQRSRASRRTF
jgi:hypothetical protein